MKKPKRISLASPSQILNISIRGRRRRRPRREEVLEERLPDGRPGVDDAVGEDEAVVVGLARVVGRPELGPGRRPLLRARRVLVVHEAVADLGGHGVAGLLRGRRRDILRVLGRFCERVARRREILRVLGRFRERVARRREILRVLGRRRERLERGRELRRVLPGRELVGHHRAKNLKTRGSLVLMDLAGSERLKRSGAADPGADPGRLREACAINRSLSCLVDVFAALGRRGDGRGRGVHVPYRNSALTRILQRPLSGDGKALLLATCNPHEAESLGTLKFAHQVAAIETGRIARRVSSAAKRAPLGTQNKRR